MEEKLNYNYIEIVQNLLILLQFYSFFPSTPRRFRTFRCRLRSRPLVCEYLTVHKLQPFIPHTHVILFNPISSSSVPLTAPVASTSHHSLLLLRPQLLRNLATHLLTTALLANMWYIDYSRRARSSRSVGGVERPGATLKGRTLIDLR